jgi:hypothetical protein
MAAASMNREGKRTEVAARDCHAAVLQRRAHHFEHVALEFGQFIEEQRAVVPA